MKKCKILMLIITIFIFSKEVNAECSYQERKDLFALTEKVSIKINAMSKKEKINLENPNSGDMEEVTLNKDYFQLNISNISEGYYIIIKNNYNGEDITIDYTISDNGVYTIDIDNISDIITYDIEYYSANDNCFAEKITTKKIKKPKVNYLYNYAICKNEKVVDNKYCKKYITQDFSLSEGQIINILNSEIESNEKQTVDNNKNIIILLKKYWYIPITVITLIAILIIILKIRKKSGEL